MLSARPSSPKPLYREQQLGVNEIAQRLHISKVARDEYLRHRKVVIRAHRKPAATRPFNFCANLLTKTEVARAWHNVGWSTDRQAPYFSG